MNDNTTYRSSKINYTVHVFISDEWSNIWHLNLFISQLLWTKCAKKSVVKKSVWTHSGYWLPVVPDSTFLQQLYLYERQYKYMFYPYKEAFYNHLY